MPPDEPTDAGLRVFALGGGKRRAVLVCVSSDERPYLACTPPLDARRLVREHRRSTREAFSEAQRLLERAELISPRALLPDYEPPEPPEPLPPAEVYLRDALAAVTRVGNLLLDDLAGHTRRRPPLTEIRE